MYKVYLLKSLARPEKSYVGRTIKPIAERLKEHNSGQARSTKPYMPWKLVYYEQFYCKLCSDKREVFLKSGKGFRLRKIILDNQKLLK
ncbi:GIY-YIG nuclease family protein [Candidatus Microgenomates bacterium]|nr:GIY-YIG nuclease family protein [Candidatus Microgenomates bacterium]